MKATNNTVEVKISNTVQKILIDPSIGHKLDDPFVREVHETPNERLQEARPPVRSLHRPYSPGIELISPQPVGHSSTKVSPTAGPDASQSPTSSWGSSNYGSA